MATNALGESFLTLLDWALRWWVAGSGPGLGFIAAQAATLAPVIRWIAAATLALAVVVGASAIIVTKRGGQLAALVVGLGRFLLVLSAGWLVFAGGWTLSDEVAEWILGSKRGTVEYVTSVTDALADAEPALAMTLSVVGAAACLAFIAVVLVRVVVGVLLMVGVPVIAAVSVAGDSSRMRIALAWSVAVLAFRPAAAIVYRISHDLVTGAREPVVVLLAVPLTFLVTVSILPGIARLAGAVRPA